jgi:hypothetical protein
VTDQFSPGEIAILAIPPGAWSSHWSGLEVLVTSGLERSQWGAMCHRIEADFLPPKPFYVECWMVEPKYLRKRRPPPDWNAMLRLRELETV